MGIDDPEFWTALLKIIGVNIVLSGDNAVVIALAARSLHGRQQKQAIFWGSGAAIVMRIILTLFAVALLALPYLKLVGSVLLLWIGVKLLVPEEEDPNVSASDNLIAAADPQKMACFCWRGGSERAASAMTTALSPDRMMLTPMIFSRPIQKACDRSSSSIVLF